MKVPKKISWVKLWLGLGFDNNGMSINFAMNISHITELRYANFDRHHSQSQTDRQSHTKPIQ